MNVVDSSGWLEYFANGRNADFFASPIETPAELIVPAISILEVFKCILREKGERQALSAAGLMSSGQVAVLDMAVALQAAILASIGSFRSPTASCWQPPGGSPPLFGPRMPISTRSTV